MPADSRGGGGRGVRAQCGLSGGKKQGKKMLKMIGYWGARSWKDDEGKQNENNLIAPFWPPRSIGRCMCRWLDRFSVCADDFTG